jgi:two-component system, OmpR family, sensor kinase
VSDRAALVRRVWSSRLPEAIWASFALGNLCWMLLVPSWAMLPYHLTWTSLLLLYGLGIRTWSRTLMWGLVAPVMVATGLLLADPTIGGHAPYDELIELPMMVIMLLVMTRLTNHRKAAMENLDAMSRRNWSLLQRQHEFVQNASHELRTPVTVALAHAELAQRDAPPGVASDVAVVVDELGRLRRLVDDLLSLATAQDSKADAARLTLAAFVERIMRRWSAIDRHWETAASGRASVAVDERRLEVAVDALLDNAVRFTGVDDRIAVSVRREGEEAVLTVADSGPGIPAAERSVVFERFRRGSGQGLEEGGPGAGNFGLGLAIVRAVAEAAGGRVTAEASSLGGAAVSIHLPLAGRRMESPAGEDAPAPAAAEALRPALA